MVIYIPIWFVFCFALFIIPAKLNLSNVIRMFQCYYKLLRRIVGVALWDVGSMALGRMVVKYKFCVSTESVEFLKERQGHLWMVFCVMNCLVFSVAPKMFL